MSQILESPVMDRPAPSAGGDPLRREKAMLRLVRSVQQLSLARSVDTIQAIVRTAARELTGADGATFVLRDGNKCYYADEDAISPLWKGQRFPMEICISGWAMLNRKPAVIRDIYQDPRIPHDAYRPTFVKSLVMVPIRTEAPIGAIGNYWAREHHATDSEVELLQALANTTAVAMESAQLYAELEQRVEERTRELEIANRELEAFSYSVSHDLRTPLNAIGGFAQVLRDRADDKTDEKTKSYLDGIIIEGKRMNTLIDDLLRLGKISRAELDLQPVSLTEIATAVAYQLKQKDKTRRVDFRLQPKLEVQADPGLMHVLVENLLSNAWKYSSKRDQPVVEFGAQTQADGSKVYFVRDNGAGFDMKYINQLFVPFKRLHGYDEFPGTGVGLTTVQRILERHGGRIWAEAAKDKGATFFFTLPQANAADAA